MTARHAGLPRPEQPERPDLAQAVLREVGPRLRAARLRRGLTLDALAAETGISASTLSRLEGGKRAPNLELLIPVTAVLRIGLDDLMVWGSAGPRHRPDRQRPRRLGPLTVEYLSPPTSPVQTFTLRVDPSPEPVRTRSHDGHQWFHVLRGRARVVLGDRDLVVSAGESTEFDTRVPHGVAALDGRPVELLAIFSHGGPARPPAVTHPHASTR
ncbi:MAG TPA: XRE family transcriptional regulator [Cellulomonas sp.]